MGFHHLHFVCVLKGKTSTRQHLKQYDAQRVQIGSTVYSLPLNLFGGHISGGTGHKAGSPTQNRPQVGQAKIGQFHVIRDHHVGRFDVAVHHALLVGIAQGLQNAHRNLKDDVQRERGSCPDDV